MLYHLNSFANAEIVTGSLQNIILKVVYSPSSVLLQFLRCFCVSFAVKLVKLLIHIII